MASTDFIDIFAAKDRVNRILRETGKQSYSRLLMNSQLPEDVLGRVLGLLENERKIVRSPAPPQPAAETTYQPVSGAWTFSG